MGILSHIDLKRSKRGQAAFSLVEVTLALGVVGFAFVPIMGLLPTGLNAFRQSMEVSVGTSIAQRVVGEAQQMDFTTLNAMVGTSSSLSSNSGMPMRYFDEQGGEIAAVSNSKWIYQANTVVKRPQAGGLQCSGMVNVIVQVVYNPSRKALPVEADGMVSGTSSLPVQTYANTVSAYK